MKLNPDCIRAVMLEIEKSHQYYLNEAGDVTTHSLALESISEALPGYSKEEIYYVLFNLEQAGYIDLTTQWAGGAVYICHVNYMTFQGHEFLNSIRDPKHWSVIKSGLSALGNFSLAAISAFAEGLGNAAISKFIGESSL